MARRGETRDQGKTGNNTSVSDNRSTPITEEWLWEEMLLIAQFAALRGKGDKWKSFSLKCFSAYI